jgi:segregation and condensation protein B
MYGTTKAFLDYFNLKSLAEMPPLAEVRALVEPELVDEQALAGGPNPEISMPLPVAVESGPSSQSEETEESSEPSVVLSSGGAEIVPLPNVDR